MVFLDIVGYTERAVTQQIGMKQRLQDLVADTVADIPKNERIIVDTGDGVALCLLGDPEQALFIALNLRDLIVNRPGDAPFSVRIGINLGPVKVVKSLSGQQNPLGDGINNAQRVMSFAEPDQILVSRSFYDVIACLSQEYARLFNFLGTRKDKHVKEHDVYEVKIPDEAGQALSVQEITQRLEQESEQQEPMPLHWEPELLQAAEAQLAQYIGPLARVLVARSAKQAHSREELYDALGATIPDETERRRFLAGVSHIAGAPVDPLAQAVTHKNTGTTGTPTPSAWDPAALAAIEHALAIYLGPLSKVLVKKAAQKTESREELCRLLASELPTEEDQHAFLRQVQAVPKGKKH